MKKVITYGTYDLLHYGHIRLLERAKELGDYLIVGVTADDFDKTRGKINVQQSLMERVEAVRATGIADEILIEEYEGQKIDDIKRLDVDIFTVGSDWEGYFDYIKEYCEVVYLPRTEGVSSTEIRAEKRKIRIGLIGDSPVMLKFYRECGFVNGLEVSGAYTNNNELEIDCKYKSYDALLENSDAVYICSRPALHYEQIKIALEKGKHVLCETPIVIKLDEKNELHDLAAKNNCILMDSIKTAYSTAYSRLILLAKTGKIGKVMAVEATATSLREIEEENLDQTWNSINAWGPTVLLPVFQFLGTEYRQKTITSKMFNDEKSFDSFTKIDFIYDDAVASVKVGKGVKSEGELVVSGTKGYIYVPAPWWKTDYFELRYENPADNKRFFYQLDGEGIRYELVAFLKAIETGKYRGYVTKKESDAICKVIEDFYNRKDFVALN